MLRCLDQTFIKGENFSYHCKFADEQRGVVNVFRDRVAYIVSPMLTLQAEEVGCHVNVSALIEGLKAKVVEGHRLWVQKFVFGHPLADFRRRCLVAHRRWDIDGRVRRWREIVVGEEVEFGFCQVAWAD